MLCKVQPELYELTSLDPTHNEWTWPVWKVAHQQSVCWLGVLWKCQADWWTEGRWSGLVWSVGLTDWHWFGLVVQLTEVGLVWRSVCEENGLHKGLEWSGLVWSRGRGSGSMISPEGDRGNCFGQCMYMCVWKLQVHNNYQLKKFVRKG